MQTSGLKTETRRDPAEFERLAAAQTPTHSASRRRANYLAYWLTWPLTLLECLLMACMSLLLYLVGRIVYFRAEGRTSRQANPLAKTRIDVGNAIGAMLTLERLGRETHARMFWISGTLLGLERMGQPLPHDTDMDAGISVDDPHCTGFLRAMWNSADVVELAPQYISLKARIQNPDLHVVAGGIIRYKAAVRNENAPLEPAVKTDIFLHFPYCGGWVHGSRNSLWWNSAVVVAHKPYGSKTFAVPENAGLYLTENYGDYRAEVKDFENSIDCPNAMNIFSWSSLAYLVRRQQIMLKLGRVGRAAQINRRIRATILKGIFPLSVRRASAQRGS